MGEVRACMEVQGSIHVSGQGAWCNFKTKQPSIARVHRELLTRHSLPAMCGRMEPDMWSEGPMGRATENPLEHGLYFISNPQP